MLMQSISRCLGYHVGSMRPYWIATLRSQWQRLLAMTGWGVIARPQAVATQKIFIRSDGLDCRVATLLAMTGVPGVPRRCRGSR